MFFFKKYEKEKLEAFYIYKYVKILKLYNYFLICSNNDYFKVFIFCYNYFQIIIVKK